MAFEWKENLACTATYKVLEGDKFLDQFEDTEIPFSKAPSVKLKTLRYFPKTTNNPQIIEVLSIEIARNSLPRQDLHGQQAEGQFVGADHPTIRIGLQNDVFLAYSAGKLPFDRRNDNIFQIGFSYKLF